METKNIVVRWTAVYETIMKVPANCSNEAIQQEAASIPIDVPGSEYQSDTWEILSFTPEDPKNKP